MSVILTACRHSKQKALERALKKKAEKKKEKREAAMHALSERLGVESLEGENNVKIWTFLLNGEPTSVVLHRDTLEVACNGDVVESTSDFCHCGATIDFRVGSRQAQIVSSPGARPRDGIVFTLSIEGNHVPDSSPSGTAQPAAMREREHAHASSSAYASEPLPGSLSRGPTEMEDCF